MKMMLCQDVFIFMIKLFFLRFLQIKIEIGRTCKELMEDIVTLVEKSEITKKTLDDLKLVVLKSAGKNFQLTWIFLMKTTKYKAIQSL